MFHISIPYEKLYKSICMTSTLTSETISKVTLIENTISTIISTPIVLSLLSFVAKQCSVTVKSYSVQVLRFQSRKNRMQNLKRVYLKTRFLETLTSNRYISRAVIQQKCSLRSQIVGNSIYYTKNRSKSILVFRDFRYGFPLRVTLKKFGKNFEIVHYFKI